MPTQTNNGLYLLQPNDCIGDSLGYFNANTLNMSNLVTTASGNIINQFTAPGSVLEQLSNPCDGSTVVGRSGTYTWPSVAAAQALTVSYADVNGSSISYTPPTGTTKVIYRFNYTVAGVTSADSGPIAHIKLFIDGTEVLYARHTDRSNGSALVGESRVSLEWGIGIGGTPSTNTGRIASWTTPKIIKLQARQYTGSYTASLHTTNTWDGAGSNQFSMPNLTITAIA
jgi:hypothetical protein